MEHRRKLCDTHVHHLAHARLAAGLMLARDRQTSAGRPLLGMAMCALASVVYVQHRI